MTISAVHAATLLAALDKIDPMSFGEPILGKTYKADGWVYRDLPRASPAAWQELMDTTGPENVVVLVESRKGDEWVRGQVLVSPAGIARCVAAAAEIDRKKSQEGK